MAFVMLALSSALVTSPARSSVPRMKCESLADMYPTRALTPVEATKIQLAALQANDNQVCWRWISPELKREIGVTMYPSQGKTALGFLPYLSAPKFRQLPLYMPLVGMQHYEVVGALAIGDDRYQCRVRVWPSGGDRECGLEPMPAPCIEYLWRLALQPLQRPVCYEDDPLQNGVSTGPPFSGCWLVDEIKLDEKRGGGDDGSDRPPVDPGDSGAERKLVSSRTWRTR